MKLLNKLKLYLAIKYLSLVPLKTLENELIRRRFDEACNRVAKKWLELWSDPK